MVLRWGFHYSRNLAEVVHQSLTCPPGAPTIEHMNATELNKKLTDTRSEPKYFHVLLDTHVSGVDAELGKIENVTKGTIIEESYNPARRTEYKVWADAEETVSTRDPQALIKIPGDKVVVFKKVITTTFTQVD